MGPLVATRQPARIVQHHIRVGHPGGFQEDDQVVIAVRHSQGLVPAVPVQRHRPTAGHSEPVHNASA
ncbi:hypothetical protein ABZX62_13340 [Streptomyces flavidovirens]|uniref:hypothetical protein n=1 Tax=Streptomyces flavidovirens TaxID=67298 RepID=UPI0033AFB607